MDDKQTRSEAPLKTHFVLVVRKAATSAVHMKRGLFRDFLGTYDNPKWQYINVCEIFDIDNLSFGNLIYIYI